MDIRYNFCIRKPQLGVDTWKNRRKPIKLRYLVNVHALLPNRYGGKDSFTLLDILMHLQKTAPVEFELIAVNLDQKQPGFPEHVLPEYLESLGVPYHIIEKDTYSVVKRVIPEGDTTCGLCSRLRRGTLYGYAEANNVTKIALGHHRDDILETFFLNIFYGGKLKAMPPKLLSDDKKNIIIRPLAYTREKDIERLAVFKDYPIIPCNLCGSQENLQRQAMKVMLKGWDKQFPGRLETIFTSLQNVAPSQLADTRLFDFAGLALTRNQQIEEQVMTFIARDGVYAASQSGTGEANDGLEVLAQ